jgi:methylenetetrahydrofolate reductase (NADPH)
MVRRGTSLTPGESEALARLLADPLFEVIPLRNLEDEAAHLPPGSLVSVTASPAKGLGATLDWAARLAAAGHRAIPHLSARMVRDRAELAELLARARASGLTRAFVVGGDADEPGDFPDGLSLLRAMAELGHPFTTLGAPGYPQGHATIPGPALLAALEAKAPYVDHVTTQMDFDAGAVASWVRARRAAGLGLEVVVGVPGVADPMRLLGIATRIGVADTKRFLGKNLRFAAGLARSGGLYRPTGFVEALAPLLAEPGAGVSGLHLYTFNGVGATDAWRREELERLGDGGGLAGSGTGSAPPLSRRDLPPLGDPTVR